ncbi:hypothetical protein TREMEDRAFT_27843 [Tremella mesenterica DSM 1558]|uniref:uncharacterized protein n=1 Tax=Tremella mesenterica (strain ATCC 24925 / CBS 8224 / DSM 1558 / NBRC 9311 / NRRL Y-6157 / RJB 2259-6 / UBC 559-6) TaxID=578456 RepID=UPI0003F49D97|nr:uncharacterized protein TREMEDRAFT_27843 [Tremella mesenterica DSM 1558]EIW71560.1 hypothetical protein TREMEDRAFT_27843 [Tremella mesenterica DSM 1558]
MRKPFSPSISRSLLHPIHRSVLLSSPKVISPLYPSSNASRTITKIDNRQFFSLPDISKLANLVPSDTDPSSTDGQQRFHTRKILPYSPEQLYHLVSDVKFYSSFIPFCVASNVLPTPSGKSEEMNMKKDKPFDMDVELVVGFGGMEERFISKVSGRPFESITATAADQSPLFHSLSATWSFSPASPLSPHLSTSPPPSEHPSTSSDPSSQSRPTLLSIDLAFSFTNPLHRIASQAVLPKVSEKMVEAFERRCMEVYGPGVS